MLTLGLYFSLCGHVRKPREDRARDEGWETYKKGWEIRFRLHPDEVGFVQSLISHAGYRPGRPYIKRVRLIQPVYGVEAAREILRAAGSSGLSFLPPAARAHEQP